MLFAGFSGDRNFVAARGFNLYRLNSRYPPDLERGGSFCGLHACSRIDAAASRRRSRAKVQPQINAAVIPPPAEVYDPRLRVSVFGTARTRSGANFEFWVKQFLKRSV